MDVFTLEYRLMIECRIGISSRDWSFRGTETQRSFSLRPHTDFAHLRWYSSEANETPCRARSVWYLPNELLLDKILERSTETKVRSVVLPSLCSGFILREMPPLNPFEPQTSYCMTIKILCSLIP